MDAPALAPIIGQAGVGATAQPTENALGGNEDDQDANSTQGEGDTSYQGVHGPALAALDDKLKATAQANASLKDQQLAITKQRAIIGQQQQTDNAALQLATQRHALAVTNSPAAGALSMSSGAPNTALMPPGAGALPNSAAAGADDWKQHTAGWDYDKHVTQQNFTQDHWDQANADMKAHTGKTAHEMYDELENKGLVLPTSANLTNRQKGELFAKFGMDLLQQQHATVVKRGAGFTPANPMAEIAKAGSDTMGNYDQILQAQRQGALQQYQDKQKIGLEAAGKQADLEKAIEERKAQAEMWGARAASQEKQTTEKVEGAGDRNAASNATRAADTGTNAAQRAKSTADATAERAAAAAARAAVAKQRADTDQAKADKVKDDKSQAELDKEQDVSLKKADDDLKSYAISTYKNDPKTGKATGEQYSREELAARYVSAMPAHQRASAATSTAQKPQAAGKTSGGQPRTITMADGSVQELSADGKTWVASK
jgi:hypothetical protein